MLLQVANTPPFACQYWNNPNKEVIDYRLLRHQKTLKIAARIVYWLGNSTSEKKFSQQPAFGAVTVKSWLSCWVLMEGNSPIRAWIFLILLAVNSSRGWKTWTFGHPLVFWAMRCTIKQFCVQNFAEEALDIGLCRPLLFHDLRVFGYGQYARYAFTNNSSMSPRWIQTYRWIEDNCHAVLGIANNVLLHEFLYGFEGKIHVCILRSVALVADIFCQPHSTKVCRSCRTMSEDIICFQSWRRSFAPQLPVQLRSAS